MTSRTLEWKTDQTLAVGKGATVQQFVALLGNDRLEIDVAKLRTLIMPRIGARPFERSRKLQTTMWKHT